MTRSRYRIQSANPISRPTAGLQSTTNQYQTTNRKFLIDQSVISEALLNQAKQKVDSYKNSLECSKAELINFAPRAQRTNFRVFENVGKIPVIHEAKDENARAMRKLINFVKPSAAQCVLQDIIYSM
jgi:hypothetical protein